MKILFLINSLVGGGAERVLVNLSDELLNQGHTVGVIVKEKKIAYRINPLLKLYHIQENNEIKSGLLRLACNYIKRYRYLRGVINDMKPDVIIASWGCNLSHVLLAHKDIPIIASEHNTFDRKHSIHEKLNRFYLNRFFDKVVVLTKYDQAYMARILKNTIVIPNPLSFKPMSEDGYKNTFCQRKNILACGRLNAYQVKGFDTLIMCFGLIANKYPNWHIDIAGTGSEKDFNRLKNVAKECGVEDRLHFLGFHNDMAQVMQQHSIFALTSRSEGFGMVVTEAMAMGCACVSFDLTGPGEIIVDGIDGVLVENQNLGDFAEALSDLIDNENKRYELGLRAIFDVKRYNPRKIAEKWENLFKIVTSNK